eukprot:13700535-Alexandrium_andersonii.AAC.1
MPRGVLQKANSQRKRWPANRKHPCPGVRPTSNSPVPGVLCRWAARRRGQSLQWTVGLSQTAKAPMPR